MRKNVEDKREALGLRYTEGFEAPQVLVRGHGDSALLMIRLAEDLGIPVLEGQSVLTALKGTEVGSYIPDSAYEVVAQLYRFVFELDKIHKGTHDDYMACK